MVHYFLYTPTLQVRPTGILPEPTTLGPLKFPLLGFEEGLAVGSLCLGGLVVANLRLGVPHVMTWKTVLEGSLWGVLGV